MRSLIDAAATCRGTAPEVSSGFTSAVAKKILPATLINLTVSDVVGDQLDYITGPTVPDTSSFDDARSVMDEFDLWGAFPASASAHLRSGGDAQETPKDFGELPLYTFVVVPGDAACVGAHERANELGFNSVILTSALEGEASQAGSFFAAIAREVVTFGRPLARPCAVIAGGENVVIIGHNWSLFLRGAGGRGVSTIMGALLVLGPQEALFLVLGLVLGQLTGLGGIAVLLGLAAMPLLAWGIGEPPPVVIYTLGAFALHFAKKMLGSRPPWQIPPPERRQVLVYRVLFDRDTREHRASIFGKPEDAGGQGRDGRAE